MDEDWAPCPRKAGAEVRGRPCSRAGLGPGSRAEAPPNEGSSQKALRNPSGPKRRPRPLARRSPYSSKVTTAPCPCPAWDRLLPGQARLVGLVTPRKPGRMGADDRATGQVSYHRPPYPETFPFPQLKARPHLPPHLHQNARPFRLQKGVGEFFSRSQSKPRAGRIGNPASRGPRAGRPLLSPPPAPTNHRRTKGHSVTGSRSHR